MHYIEVVKMFTGMNLDLYLFNQTVDIDYKHIASMCVSYTPISVEGFRLVGTLSREATSTEGCY